MYIIYIEIERQHTLNRCHGGIERGFLYYANDAALAEPMVNAKNELIIYRISRQIAKRQGAKNGVYAITRFELVFACRLQAKCEQGIWLRLTGRNSKHLNAKTIKSVMTREKTKISNTKDIKLWVRYARMSYPPSVKIFCMCVNTIIEIPKLDCGSPHLSSSPLGFCPSAFHQKCRRTAAQSIQPHNKRSANKL